MIDKYGFRVFWSDGDGGYIAVCPEFPRLSGFGETAEKAVAELHGVLEEAIEIYREEGWPLPEPTMSGGYSGQFRVRVAKSLHAALADRAEVEGVSMNSLASQYLAQGLARELGSPGHD
jgi:antitoxin HicB